MKQFNNTKNITIEYYGVYAWREYENQKNTIITDKCEISPLLKALQEKPVIKRTINYNGENLILSSIIYNSSSKLWELVFFKSRSASVPFIVNSNGASRSITLKNDEMVSEVLCVEYNPETKIIAMQRNIYAFGTKGLETFFSSFMNYPIFLKSIVIEEKKKLLTNSKLKKFKLHVKTTKDKNSDKPSNKIAPYKKNTTICKVIDAALAVDSAIINIEFSMGNSAKTIDIENDDFEIFQDLMNNNNVKCLELGLVPDEHSTMQITDFMDFRIHDSISISFIKGQPINISEVLKKITEKFKKNIYLEEVPNGNK